MLGIPPAPPPIPPPGGIPGIPPIPPAGGLPGGAPPAPAPPSDDPPARPPSADPMGPPGLPPCRTDGGAYDLKSLVPPLWLNRVLLCTLSPSYACCIIGAIIWPRGVERNSFGYPVMSLGMPWPSKKSAQASVKWLQLCSNTWYVSMLHSDWFSRRNSMKRSSGISVKPRESYFVGTPNGVLPGWS